MLKKVNQLVPINKKRTFLIITLNIIEAFFLISGVFLLFPFIKYLIGGKVATLELFKQEQYSHVFNVLNSMNVDINLLNLIILAIAPVLLGQFTKYLKMINIVSVQQDIIYKLRGLFIKKLFDTNIGILKSSKIGELANTISNESMRVGVSIQYVLNFYSFLFIAFIYMIILFGISINLLLFTLIGVSIVPFVVKKQNKELKKLSRVVSSSNENIQNFIIEKIKVLKKVILLNQQTPEIKTFQSISKTFEETYLKSGKITAIVDVILEPLIFIIAMFIVYIGVAVLNLGFDTIVVFLFVLMKFNQAIKSAIMAKNQINTYMGSYELYKRYLDRLSENQVRQNGIKIYEKLENSIQLKNIVFGYSESENLFDNLNLHFLANQTTALIGKSGSGKSTIVDILLGFNDIDSGKVLFDESDIYELDIVSLRKNIGFVTQDVYLFHGTIKENLLYGLSEKSDDEIKIACEKAYILDFVESLKDGFDTQVGESGGKLSGGQKQRLQLAHLFLQKPDIIIMDEPTSALDSESERVIVDTLKELHSKKTIIIIAHRLSTIQHADKIVVLEDGKVLEEGTHDELIRNDSRYREYFEGNKS